MQKLKPLLARIKNLLDRLPLDNKLIVGGVTWVLTYAVTKAGFNLDQVVLSPYTLSTLISLAAAGVAGWWTSNEATALRRGEEQDGNPDLALVEAKGLKE